MEFFNAHHLRQKKNDSILYSITFLTERSCIRMANETMEYEENIFLQTTLFFLLLTVFDL